MYFNNIESKLCTIVFDKYDFVVASYEYGFLEAKCHYEYLIIIILYSYIGQKPIFSQ